MMRWCLESAVWIAWRSPSIATNAPDQGVRVLRDRRQSIGLCKMAATNKCLARSNKSRTGVPATNKRPAARRNSSARRQLASTRCGVSAAGLLPPFGGASRAEAEHGLSLFHCLRVWGYCIDRCYLVDPSFVHVIWRLAKAPIRIWVPLLFFLGLIFLIQVVSSLIGPNATMALVFILAGVAK